VTGREPVQQKWQQLRDNAGFKGLRWLAWLQRFRPMARAQAAPGSRDDRCRAAIETQ
jgi:hypothetical protein